MVITDRTADRIYFFFVSLVFVLLMLGLGSYGLAESSEARYAEISREMFVSGDYLNPQLLGIFHFHKPPITYYITSLGYGIFGINEFGARFFLQLAVVIQLLIVYGMANLLFDSRKTAFMSGLIYFAMPLVLISSHNLTTDAYLNTFLMAAIYCWQLYTTRKKIIFLYVFYGLAGIAMLTKGPVALLFILLYILTYKIIFKTGSRFSVHHALGLLLFFGISSSWFVLILVKNPELFDYFIEKQLMGRITGASYSERSQPFWYFLPVVLVSLLPWFPSFAINWKIRKMSLADHAKEARLLLVNSFLLLLIFSAFKTKLVLYILPVFWMISIFLGFYLGRISVRSRKIISLSYIGLLSLIVMAFLYFWAVQSNYLKISGSEVLIGLLTILIASGGYYYIPNKKVYKPAVIAALFSISVLVNTVPVLTNNPSLLNSTVEIAQFIETRSGRQEETVLVYDHMLSSIPFYSHAREIILQTDHDSLKREVQFQKDLTWKEGILDLQDPSRNDELEELLSNKNTYLLIRKGDLTDGHISFLTDRFNHNEQFPKWTLFYNE